MKVVVFFCRNKIRGIFSPNDFCFLRVVVFSWAWRLAYAQVLLEISFDFCEIKTVLKAQHLYGFSLHSLAALHEQLQQETLAEEPSIYFMLELFVLIVVVKESHVTVCVLATMGLCRIEQCKCLLI